ncbi:unnamed protein product [Pedinophyceae sp. YPF-701]|nr:unnamed protein product [Pedinophyceae sp. YPF-701]
MHKSDGKQHLGSALSTERNNRPFPGPPPDEGPPLRVLPIGGLGEIGMNCMLVGVRDRYILIDAGLMFPDQAEEPGIQKILPDCSFLARWRDKIEAVVITHGHEDHIGAMPWVIPALDPRTPVYAGSFVMALVQRRMQEFGLWDETRFHTFKMRERIPLGPFECEPIRVTHSIPDCCGLILRSPEGNIVHTGDWRIDEEPVDGQHLDREAFEQIGKEGVALMMSDSTNVLSPGRTMSESVVEKAVIERVLGHKTGRVIATQFASNIHRLGHMKKAADLAGRKLCFVGTSLNVYMDAAFRDGTAPFNPADLIHFSELDEYDPSEVMVVTTGSQAEPRAALNLASQRASNILTLQPEDLILYSAKMIPGNEKKVVKMFNRIAEMGPQIAQGRDENLHTSGHAYKEELREVIQLVNPQHFLPVHGEYSFLCAHAELAEECGVQQTTVVRNGNMVGAYDKRNAKHVSSGTMQIIGEARLTNYYNDGNYGTGTAGEMSIKERTTLATEGIVIAAVDILRRPPGEAGSDRAWQSARLAGKIRVTTRGMWVDNGRLLQQVYQGADRALTGLPLDTPPVSVERAIADAIRKVCRRFNSRTPEVVVITHEADMKLTTAVLAQMDQVVERSGRPDPPRGGAGRGGRSRSRSNSPGRGRGGRGRGGRSARGAGPIRPVGEQEGPRRAQTPRDDPGKAGPGADLSYG